MLSCVVGAADIRGLEEKLLKMKLTKVGVVGAGNIGTGVIADLVLHSISVVIVDVSKQVLERAETEILKNVRFAPLLSKTVSKMSKSKALEFMRFATSFDELAPCEFIIENVTEDWKVKKEVYERLDRVMPPDICFGSNTSCISITKIGSATQRPANVVGMHFMNPVHMKSTVEVIRGNHTSDHTLEVVNQLFSQLGKESIVVGDLPGFVSNRISHLFMNEAAFVLQDNIATAEKIDLIFKKCFGHKMGPLETADLIGLDTVVRSLDVLYESYQDPKYRCSPVLRKMVDAGHLGRKSGKGFFVYPES